jgi:hypothetical protein
MCLGTQAFHDHDQSDVLYRLLFWHEARVSLDYVMLTMYKYYVRRTYAAEAQPSTKQQSHRLQSVLPP